MKLEKNWGTKLLKRERSDRIREGRRRRKADHERYKAACKAADEAERLERETQS